LPALARRLCGYNRAEAPLVSQKFSAPGVRAILATEPKALFHDPSTIFGHNERMPDDPKTHLALRQANQAPPTLPSSKATSKDLRPTRAAADSRRSGAGDAVDRVC
jgi:hypothetical protein